MLDPAFLMDMTEHMNNLNKMLLGRNKVVMHYYVRIHPFKSFWGTQLAGGDAAHFPCLKDG